MADEKKPIKITLVEGGEPESSTTETRAWAPTFKVKPRPAITHPGHPRLGGRHRL
ncbi:MAG: hypothetical protein IPL65_12870 [Lewinellaceae bacterium]|nr:hypothetical protein [Lewinellaceae bacterium]